MLIFHVNLHSRLFNISIATIQIQVIGIQQDVTGFCNLILEKLKPCQPWLVTYSAFTLPTSETGLVSFSKVDISRTTDTCQVSVVLLISAFENENKTSLAQF